MKRRDQLSLALCCLSLALAVLCIGGATRWAQACVAAVVAISVATTVPARRRFGRWPPLLVLFGVAFAWTVVQWLPLPDALVSTLTPTLDALRRDGAALAGVHASSTLSVDPPATLRAAIFLVTLSGIALVALRLAVSEAGRYALCAAVAGLAGLTAVIAGIHELVSATALYGVYEPRYGVPPILGPLLNTNHLGCFMAVGAVTSTGLLFHPRGSVARRILWGVCAAACIAVTAATYSRGAMIGLAAGTVVTLATIVAQRMNQMVRVGSRERRERFLVTSLPIGVVVLCGLVLAVYLGAGTVIQQLEQTSLDEINAPKSKFEAWRSSMQLVEDAPWTGVGRGAFQSAFTRVHPASAFFTFSHPENEAVQAVTEWGIPGSLVLALLAGWTVILALRRWTDGPLAAGALGALMVVAFQSNFDFGMELLGVAAPVVVLLSVLTYVPLNLAREEQLRHLRQERIGYVGIMLCGAVLLLTPATQPLGEAHETLSGSPTRAEIIASIEQHPLDYVAFAALAEQLAKVGERGAVSVLNHALRLHPTHPGLHWIAARLLVRQHPAQAESEYLMAVRYSKEPRPVIAELVAQLPAERAASALPTELPIATTTAILRELGRADVALYWVEHVLAVTGDPRAADSLYALALTQKDFAAAERAARSRCSDLPTPRCQIDLARVLVLQGRREEEIALLHGVADWQGKPDDRITAWLMLCDAHAARGSLGDARSCLRRLEISGLVEPANDEVQRRLRIWKQ